MNKIFPLIILFIVVASCNKVKRIENKMSGDWNIVAYTFQNVNGLSYKYTASGIFSFENCESEFCNYDLKIEYYLNGSTIQKESAGSYTMLSDAEHFELKRMNTDESTSLISGRILHINKSQLETEFKDESGIHFLVLEKRN